MYPFKKISFQEIEDESLFYLPTSELSHPIRSSSPEQQQPRVTAEAGTNSNSNNNNSNNSLPDSSAVVSSSTVSSSFPLLEAPSAIPVTAVGDLVIGSGNDGRGGGGGDGGDGCGITAAATSSSGGDFGSADPFGEFFCESRPAAVPPPPPPVISSTTSEEQLLRTTAEASISMQSSSGAAGGELRQHRQDLDAIHGGSGRTAAGGGMADVLVSLKHAAMHADGGHVW